MKTMKPFIILVLIFVFTMIAAVSCGKDWPYDAPFELTKGTNELKFTNR